LAIAVEVAAGDGVALVVTDHAQVADQDLLANLVVFASTRTTAGCKTKCENLI
jgi:hypothetical protein